MATPKVVEMLSKMINVMKDLMKLSKRHHIENELYYGDGLNRIYREMDGNRRRKWLERIQTSSISKGEAQWDGLIEFLENELEVAQQEAIIMAKATTSTGEQRRDRRDPPSSYHSEGDANVAREEGEVVAENKQCLICGEEDHVQTNGPGGIKLVQYSIHLLLLELLFFVETADVFYISYKLLIRHDL